MKDEVKVIECPHLHKLQTLFIYDIAENTELHLCEFCNMRLAAEVMKQMALQTFCPKLDDEA